MQLCPRRACLLSGLGFIPGIQRGWWDVGGGGRLGFEAVLLLVSHRCAGVCVSHGAARGASPAARAPRQPVQHPVSPGPMVTTHWGLSVLIPIPGNICPKSWLGVLENGQLCGRMSPSEIVSSLKPLLIPALPCQGPRTEMTASNKVSSPHHLCQLLPRDKRPSLMNVSSSPWIPGVRKSNRAHECLACAPSGRDVHCLGSHLGPGLGPAGKPSGLRHEA